MAIPVAADGQRVDRIHLVTGRDQGTDEQATVGLGSDHHLGRVLGLAGQQLMHQPQPSQPVCHPPGRQQAAVGGHHGHIVVVLGPIEPDKQQPVLLPSDRPAGLSLRRPATP